MIISIAIQNIPNKVCTYSFVVINLYPHHRFSFAECVNMIVPSFRKGYKVYFWNHEESYYDAILYILKILTVIKLRELMSIIDHFTTETPRGKSLWTKRFFFPNSFFFLTKIPR